MTNLKSETRDFSAEIGKVLHLMINSLYTNKDTCLRELISNAADACDKLRYLSQFDPAFCKRQEESKITICIDRQNNKLRIKDSGIGMNREELLSYLGSIASSGTRRFLEQMTGDKKNDNTLIGQFGVGFYSVFMIGSRVEVKTCKAGDDQSYLWTSQGLSSYTISNLDEKCEGTEVVIYLKELEDNYLDFDYVKGVILKYSDNISVPIFLEKSESVEKTQINSATALWALNKSEISSEQYRDFYQRVFYATDLPWKILHNKNEGFGGFTNLLFIPSEKTFDLFSSDRKRRVKLYVKRVFVTEEGVDLIPYYLRFVRGVIDTDSVSLNISREMIQNSPALATIQRVVTTRILKVLKEAMQLAFEEYKVFWNNFGAVVKEGLCEDSANVEILLELCLFYSALSGSYVTLSQYLEKQNQAEKKAIYYITGESLESLSNSPQIEGFLKQNVDVLLMIDAVDSFWLSMISQHKDIPFVSVAKSSVVLPNSSSQDLGASKDASSSLCQYFKECLGALVKDVQISKKLVDSPACLAVTDGSMDSRMERFLLSQNHISSISAKVMEINFDHPLIRQINSKVLEGSCVS